LQQDYYPIAGKWFKIIEKNGKRLLVIHLLGSVFMNHVWVENPYIKIDKILKEIDEDSYDAIVLDFHKEASSEWYAMAHFLEKTPAFVFGTHTHVQTNDELIFPSWVGVIWDVGMTGPLYSVIWADFHSVRKRMLTGIQKGKIEQSLDKNYVVNGIFVEFWDDKKCVNLEKFRIRNSL
jgi:calcineurin-like phosphoesterase